MNHPVRHPAFPGKAPARVLAAVAAAAAVAACGPASVRAQAAFSTGGRSQSAMGVTAGDGQVISVPGGTIIRREAPLPPPAVTPGTPLQLASLEFRPVSGETQGLRGRIVLPRGSQNVFLCAGRFDEARHRALLGLRQELARIDAELRRDTAPVEYEGIPSVRVLPNGGAVVSRSTTAKRSARDAELARRQASERVRSRIDAFLKTFDWRIRPAEDGSFAVAPIPPGRYILFVAARVPDEGDGKNIAPSRQLYWAGVFDYEEGHPLGAVLGERNGTEWQDLFLFR